MPRRPPTKVLLACSGLEHAKRGFESFSRGCFEALRGEEGLEIELIKGSGPSGAGERSVSTLTRDARLARWLSRRSGHEPFRFEQAAFGLSLQAELLRRRPDVVYFSEWHTGLVLAWARRRTRARHRLVLCNGTMAVEGFGHLDRVQELTPPALRLVLQRGASPARHTLLPLGVAMPSQMRPLHADERRRLRARLRLPEDRAILLCVAAFNRYHKRIDYLIEEVRRLPEPRPFLLLVGQPDAETPGLRSLAAGALGPRGHEFRTVDHSEMADVYRSADAFVLTSLGESFGLVLVEAMSHGLPCLVHDYEITRFVLGDHGHFSDLARAGALSALLKDIRAYRHDPVAERRRHRFAYDSFSWDSLRPRYVELLAGAANRTVSASTGEKLSSQSR